MKNLIFYIFLLSSSLVKSQDLWVQSVNYLPLVLNVNSPAVLSTGFAITDVSAPAGCVSISIDLPPNITLSSGVGSVFSGDGSHLLFNWFLSGGDLVGVTNTDILDGGGVIMVNVRGFSVSANAMTFVSLNETGLCGPFVDDPGTENQLSSTNEVAPALPIELSSFYGKVVDCEYIDLKWETASEQNNAYMEILRSTDGKEFLSIGRVEGSNNSRGSSYSLEDRNFLEPGTKYLYKIRQVDFDGTMTHHKLIAVQYDCQGAKPEMKLYPNPAMDNLNVTISGIKLSQDVSFHLYDSEGALVRTLFIASDRVNELSLIGLSPGIYHIKSVNLDEPVYARFIKIE